MPKVAIITDSTSEMTSEFAEAHNIHVVPLYILFGTESLRDGVDLDSVGFFDRLETDPHHPQTSQPTPADFAQACHQVRTQTGAEEICVFTISSELSGTYESAIKAKADVDFPVHVVDTRMTSVALALIVLAAAEAANQGAGSAEVLRAGKSVMEKIKLLFAVDTLEYLHRGGRIGSASKFIGTMLSIKPILELLDGKVLGKEKIRTKRRALTRLLDLIDESIDSSRPIVVATGHGKAEKECDWITERVKERFELQELHTFKVGATIGTHVGPGLVGIAFYQP